MNERWKLIRRTGQALPPKEGEVIVLKQITFVPRLSGITPMTFFYCVAGDEVYFSSVSDNTTTSINCEEEMITQICQRERFVPNGRTFFDINTNLGYRDLAEGEARIYRLELDHTKPHAPGLRFSVDTFVPLELPVGHPVPEGTRLTGIPLPIREMFTRFIGTPRPETPNWTERLLRDTFRV